MNLPKSFFTHYEDDELTLTHYKTSPNLTDVTYNVGISFFIVRAFFDETSRTFTLTFISTPQASSKSMKLREKMKTGHLLPFMRIRLLMEQIVLTIGKHFVPFSPKEEAVFECMHKNYTLQQIMDELHIDREEIVQNAIQRIKRKLSSTLQ
jgi:hypothetical protein